MCHTTTTFSVGSFCFISYILYFVEKKRTVMSKSKKRPRAFWFTIHFILSPVSCDAKPASPFHFVPLVSTIICAIMAKKGAEEPGMQIDAPNRDFPRRCEKTRWHGSVGRTNCTKYPTGLADRKYESMVAWLTQKGDADHLKTAYPCRLLVHINQ